MDHVFPIEIPTTMKFTGPKGTGAASSLQPDITGANFFSRILDSSAPNRVRSILPSDLAPKSTVLVYPGATIIAQGLRTTDSTGTHNVAAFADFKIAEHVIVGTLESVDLTTGVIVVAGQPCKMNPDERFISSLVDRGNSPLTIQRLHDFGIGDVITIVGYRLDGVCYVNTLQTTALVAAQGVSITQADGVAKSNTLTMKGAVAVYVPGQTVSIYNAVTNQLLGTVATTLNPPPVGGGVWNFKPKAGSFTIPTKVKVVTSNGGLTATANVIIK
ncbi:MAG: hypothetical protein DWH81_15030 [Planctomycetota bacterium]|nr:MAG: hypothetical protein DWH81_15030 [Planctomycetota bacterium]